MIDLDWIQRLIDMVDGSDVDSLEISRFATRVRISKSPPMHVVAGTAAAPAAAGNSGPPAPASSPASAPAAEAGGEAKKVADREAAPDDTVAVESPMVGTFYRAPAPDAPPYVEVGDRIQKGQTLCILEAMKLMNELEAEVSGTVREICVGNGEPVEYGQVLFRVEPS